MDKLQNFSVVEDCRGPKMESFMTEALAINREHKVGHSQMAFMEIKKVSTLREPEYKFVFWFTVVRNKHSVDLVPTILKFNSRMMIRLLSNLESESSPELFKSYKTNFNRYLCPKSTKSQR